MAGPLIRITGAGPHREPEHYVAATRVVVAAEAATTHRWMTLLDPPRLVFDLKPARIAEPTGSLTIGDGLVRMVRWAAHPDDRVRIVVDLERPAPHRAFWTANPVQLLVDVDRVSVALLHHQRSQLEALPLTEYLIGVLAAEVPPAFQLEALKAQAVAARSYTLHRLRDFGGAGCPAHPTADACTDPAHGQAYLSLEGRRERWGGDWERLEGRLRRAVAETARLYLRHGAGAADSVYHSTCGGHTASAADVWGADVPYLVSVPCEYCRISSRYRSTREVTLADFERQVERDVLRVTATTPSGRAGRVIACGRELDGGALRQALGLNSTWIADISGAVSITTRGLGHGVGLCQWGAEGQARLGRSYQDILAYYYRGLELAGVGLEPDRGAGGAPQAPPSPEPAPAPPVPPAPAPPRPRVVLDPGHGGRDPGAVGPRQLFEKDVNLAVARAAAGFLEDRVELILTRTQDETVSLRSRTNLANQARADLLVSVHANGSIYPEAHGTETFHYPGSRLGSRLAGILQQRLVAALGRRDRGVKQADFFVLRETRCPAALVELLFVTNPEEARRLADPEVQQRAGAALAAGILDYLAGPG